MPSATKYYHITYSSEGLKPVKEVKLKSPASVYRHPCLGFRPSFLWEHTGGLSRVQTLFPQRHTGGLLGFRPSSLGDTQLTCLGLRSLWWSLCFDVKSCTYHCVLLIDKHSNHAHKLGDIIWVFGLI